MKLFTLLRYSCYRLFGGKLGEKEFLCNDGQHDWSELVEAHRGKSRDTSPLIINLPDGKQYEMAQVIREGSRSCQRQGCDKTQKVSQVALLSPVPKEVLDKLPIRDAKKFHNIKSRWFPQKEEEIDHTPR